MKKTKAKRKPNYERTLKVSVPLFDFVTVELVLTSDMRASEDKRGIGKKDIGSAHTFGDEGNGSNITVLLPTPTPGHLIAHEAVHVASLVLTAAGVIAGIDNDEPIAYLVDWFTGWVVKLVK